MSETSVLTPTDQADVPTIEVPIIRETITYPAVPTDNGLAKLVERHREYVANNPDEVLPPPDNTYVGRPIDAGSSPLAPPTVSSTEAMSDNSDPSSPEGPPPESPSYEPDSDLNKLLSGVQMDVSSGVISGSRDYGDEHVRQETIEPGVKGFLKKIWHGNIARDYIRQRAIVHGDQRIIDERNMYVLVGGTRAEHDDAMSAVVERFVDEGNIHLHQGETIQQADNEYAGQLRELITSFARGDTGYDALLEGKTRLTDQFGRQQHAEDRNKGKMYADNLIEVAINARAAFEHGVGLAAINDALSLRVGEARMGARTESSREMTDRILDKAYNIPGLNMVNETTVGLGVAVGMAVAKFTTRKFLTAASRTVGLGVGTGIIGGVRESHRVGQERRLHSRQMAEGGEIDEDDGARRLRMEATRYNTVEASELLAQLRSANEESSTPDLLSNLTRLLEAVTEADTRINLSDDSNIDLISYEGKVSIERQRADLDRALAESKVRLQGLLNDSDDATLAGLGIEERSLDEVISSHSEYVRDLIENDIFQKDREFRHLRRQRVLTAAAIGATVGIVLGESSQEIHTLFDHTMQGVFDHPEPSQDRQTELAALFHNHPTPASQHPNANFDHSSFKLGNDALDLPPGYHVAHNAATGALELVGADNKVVADNIGFGPNGYLNAATTHILQEKGFGLHTSSEVFNSTHAAAETVSSSPESYIQTHPHEFTSVHRELWYDNNTPYPDKNELATWWGGENNTGIDAQGNFVLNISHMMPGGSYEGNQSANYLQLLHEGKLELAVSLNSNTQGHVILIPFDSHGNAIINAKDPALQSVFVSQAGHAHFIGGFAEVVQNTGKDAQGETGIKMLSTVVGDNHPRAISETVQHLVQEHGQHVVTHLEAPAGAPLPVEIAPAIPVYARRGMETLGARSLAEVDRIDYFGYRGEPSDEQLRRWENDKSPRLRVDAKAVLDTQKELDWYRSHLESRRGAEYLTELDGYINNSEVLKNIDDSIDAIVSIPVAAANESDNIYNTLSLYAQQSAEAKQRTILMLNVNWREELEATPEIKTLIDKTLSEIERAKVDFPELKIATFEKTWSPEFVEARNDQLYGEVVKVLYDVGALAMEQAIREGRRSDKDALIITNDADANGLRNNYLDTYLSALTKYPESDAFTGLIRFGTESHRKYPGFGISTNIMMLLSAASGRSNGDYTASPSTPGANSAFRLSSFAAIGGCDDSPDVGAGADTVLGRKLRAARLGAESVGVGALSTPSSLSTGGVISSTSSDAVNSRRSVIRHLVGAQIDTNADRFLGVYRQGRVVGSAWRDFDVGGYRDRSEELQGLDNTTEKPTANIESIAERIEREISFLGTEWHPEHGLMSWALGAYLGSQDADGNPLYDIHWDRGFLDFKFTDEGKAQLKKRLTRDRNGRFDNYGRRTRRQLYGEVAAGSRREAPAVRRFVRAA